MLARLIGITVAGGLAALLQKPRRADATIMGTLFTTSSANFGLTAAPANALVIPVLGTTTHGVIGNSSATGTGPGADYSSGVFGTDPGLGVGVQGISTNLYGVYGKVTGTVAGSAGVYGTAVGNPGVKGISTSGPGVFGTSTTAYGVQGASQNAYGVSGNSTTQAGVWGSSNSNVGVLGTSTSGVGVNGVSTSSNGVHGLSTTGIGVYGSSPSGLAGRFDGNVVIQGDLTVSGNFPHSAAVPSSDGTLRRLYSFEGTEAYYEDLGQGSLVNGVGLVTLDPAFVALVRADVYQVFLTAYGDSRGLYVSQQTSSGFEVREVQGGTSSIGFGYRVLARPQHGASPRLERVTLAPPPAQPKLDRIEPLDVPATLRDLRHHDGPTQGPAFGEPSHQQDGR